MLCCDIVQNFKSTEKKVMALKIRDSTDCNTVNYVTRTSEVQNAEGHSDEIKNRGVANLMS